MVTVTQSIIIFAAFSGITLLIYANFFSFVRLRIDQRRALRQERREEMAEAVSVSTAVALPVMSREQMEESMYYLYQEQVRRFIDAKIDVMRSMTDTQNRLSLMQAEVVRLRNEKELRLVEQGVLPANNDTQALPAPGTTTVIDAETGATALAVISSGANPAGDPDLEVLREQHHATRVEAQRQLQEIDAQMRSLPGPSMDRWVASQTSRLAQAAD